MNPISKLEIYGIALLLLGLAIGAAYLKGKHEGMAEIQAKFDLFTAQVKAEGEKAKADALQKEKDDAKRIADAVTERDVALQRMRSAQAAADAARRAVPLTPAATAGSSLICFEQKALSAAVERYRGRVRGLVAVGDETAIDAAALIKAWPSATADARSVPAAR